MAINCIYMHKLCTLLYVDSHTCIATCMYTLNRCRLQYAVGIALGYKQLYKQLCNCMNIYAIQHAGAHKSVCMHMHVNFH